MRAFCSNCGAVHNVGDFVAGKLFGSLGGSLLGPAVYQATGNKTLGALAGLLGTGLGAAAGHVFVDASMASLCPRCRAS